MMVRNMEDFVGANHSQHTSSLSSKYHIGPIIGRGSYGVAYSATRISDGEPVVVKQIKMYELDASGQQAALSEARTLSQFDHINIIHYHESVIEDGCLNIVMEYAQCGDLSEVISRRAREKLPFEEDDVMCW